MNYILSFLRRLFISFDVEKPSLDEYVASQYPKSINDVEMLERQYFKMNHAYNYRLTVPD